MNTFDPKKREEEKRLSREKDEEDLKTGKMSIDELNKKNGKFAFPNVKIDWDKAKPLS